MLPNLIFICNDHSSPLTPDFLTAIMPMLRELGYDVFYDEMKATTSAENLKLLNDSMPGINHTLDFLKAYLQIWLHGIDTVAAGGKFNPEEEIKTRFHDTLLNHDIANKIKFVFSELEFLMKYSPPGNHTPDFMKSQLKKGFQRIIDKVEIVLLSASSNIKFYNALHTNEIQYQGVDNADCLNLLLDIHAPDHIRILFETMDLRDKTMAEAYLNAQKSFLARIGALHHKGIKKYLTQQPPLTGETRYVFIDLRQDNDIHDESNDCSFTDEIFFNLTQLNVQNEANRFIDILTEMILQNNVARENTDQHKRSRSRLFSSSEYINEGSQKRTHTDEATSTNSYTHGKYFV